MSASNRKIHRLPDRLFEDLITRPTTMTTRKAVPSMMVIGDNREEKKMVKKKKKTEKEKQTKNKENSKNNNECGSSDFLKHDDGVAKDDDTASGAIATFTGTDDDKITADGKNKDGTFHNDEDGDDDDDGEGDNSISIQNNNNNNNSSSNKNNNNNNNNNNNPSLLRHQICHRLQRVPVRYVTGGRFFSRRVRCVVDGRDRAHHHHHHRQQYHHDNNHNSTTAATTTTTTTLKIETVGELFMLSKYTLLLVLDPILTYEEIEILLARISFHCAPRPVNVLTMKKRQSRSNSMSGNDKILPSGGSDSEKNVRAVSSRSTKKRFPIRQIHPNSVVPTGLENLDRLLRGGIRVGTVTELVGRSGVGKTQLAFQLAIMAAKNNCSTIYIDTEKKISVHRLKEMAAYRYNNNALSFAASQGGQVVPFSYGATSLTTTSLTANSQEYSSSMQHLAGSPQDMGINNIGNNKFNFKHAEDVVKNMSFRRPDNTEELLQTLKSLEAEIVHWNEDNTGTNRQHQHRMSDGTIDIDQNNHHLNPHYHFDPNQHTDASMSGMTTSQKFNFPVRLIVVDSIAATMRRDFGTDALPQRASAIFQCAQILKRLADHLSIAIFVINQVGGADNSNNDMGGSNGTGVSKDPTAVKAALGTSWHHCVSTRLFMEKSLTIPQQHPDHQYAEEYLDEHWQQQFQQQQRSKVAIVKSNLVPLAETSYKISAAGIV